MNPTYSFPVSMVESLRREVNRRTFLRRSGLSLGATALGKVFRRYSFLTIIVFVVFGTLTGIESPGIARNLPTPMIGVWERINIAAFMLWVVVFPGAIMRQRTSVLALSRTTADCANASAEGSSRRERP